MKNLLILITLLVPIIGSPDPCNLNEEYRECGPPKSYEDTCNEKFTIIPEICMQGCYCLDGFVRTSREEDLCVPIEECLACSEHQHFRKCGSHQMCQRTCDNLEGSIVCPAMCVQNCQCDDGYVQVSQTNFTCVSVENCNL